MRNLLDDNPDTNESGHSGYVERFVAIDDLAGKDVLDIGCGFGWFERIALRAGARSIVGIEPTERDLATVRKHLVDERVRFDMASATDLPYADASFDTIVMWEVLEHIPKTTETAAFAEIARVLRPGGVLYLSTPHASVVARVTDPAWWVAGHRHYTRAAITAYSHGAGLTVEVNELKAGMPQVLYMLNLYVAKWIFRRPPFFDEWALRRVRADWARTAGFTAVFLRARRGAA